MLHFVHLLMGTALFLLLTIVNNATMNTGVQVPIWNSVFNSSKYISVAYLGYTIVLFNFFRNHHVVFPNKSTIFLPTNKSIRVPISSQSHQSLLSSEEDDECHARKLKTLSHSTFDFYLTNDKWCWAFSHMRIGHLNIFIFGKMFIQVLCPFVNWIICLCCRVVGVLYIIWILNPY